MQPSKTKLVVVGQGYVGLPVAMRAVDVGYEVVGVDLDTQRVTALEQGISFVEDVSDDTLAAALNSGRYKPTENYALTESFDFAVITVPTPLREGLPDLSFIESAAQALAPRITRGAVVILESTTYPGTTDELLVPLLEEGSGLACGEDFFVGYSPERIDPGNPRWGFVNTPKVVSGVDNTSLEVVNRFYSTLVDTTVPVKSPKEAELTKLLENTFRHVNIALVNELAMFAHELGVNVWDAIDAASTKPFGYMRFTPGPGVGGHCLPVDPSYLSWQVRRTLGRSFRFVELANDVNDHMPDYVVQRAIQLLNDAGLAMNGASVLVVGIAYKRDSGDVRESPALRVIELLQAMKANVIAVDPHVEAHRWPRGVEVGKFDRNSLEAADLAIVVTDHSDFDLTLLTESNVSVLDTRRSVPESAVVHRL